MKLIKIEDTIEAFNKIDEQTGIELGEIDLNTDNCKFRVNQNNLANFLRFLNNNQVFKFIINSCGNEFNVFIDGEIIREINCLVSY